MTVAQLTVRLPKLLPGQSHVKNLLQRFNVIIAGRRWGKTRFCSLHLLEQSLKKSGVYWWISPSYPMGTIAWRLIKRLVKKIPLVEVREAERTIVLPNGSLIVYKSADREDSLRGESLSGVVFDEVAFIAEDRWTAEIRPALIDAGGWAIFIGTPKGKNWVYRLFVDAEGKPGWFAIQLPTSNNPIIPQGEIEEARRDTPEYIFQQEYLALFLDDTMGVFRNIQEISDLPILQKPEDHKHDGDLDIYFGVDLGKQQDFTVITGFCRKCKQQVLLDRFNDIDYGIQKGRIKTSVDVWKPRRVVVETNNVGIAIIEDLRKMGVPVQAFTTTAASKPDLIESFALAMESKVVRLVNSEVQKAELSVFEMNTTKTGHRQYAAPQGHYHDDVVLSLALAWHGAKRSGILASVVE